MIVFRFVVTFDDVDDVERIIDVHASNTLKDFSDVILSSVGFSPDTEASFYLATDNWRKGKRFANHIEEEGHIEMMTTRRLNEVVNNPHQRFLYFTDDDMAWELHVELLRIYKSNETDDLPKLVKASGPNPKQFTTAVIGAPTNEFERLVEELVQEEDAHEMSDDDEDLVGGVGDEDIEDVEDSDDEGDEEDEFDMDEDEDDEGGDDMDDDDL
ncbi:MAG: hypothetical protein H6606_08825 [Flavobacteriales bacterium]|nr:hypothetical protein [Flavobacteriales bacterium]